MTSAPGAAESSELSSMLDAPLADAEPSLRARVANGEGISTFSTAFGSDPRIPHTRLHGHARDQFGRAIGGLEVWVVPARKTRVSQIDRCALEEPVAGQGIYRVNLDVEGAYSIEDVGVGDWWVGIAPPPASPDGRDTSGLFRSMSTVKLTTLTDDYEIDLTGYWGLSVRGRVGTPEGEPVPNASVEAKLNEDDEFHMFETSTDEHGDFELAPLPPGALFVFAKKEGEFLPSELERVYPGTTDLRLELAYGGHLVVSVVDAASGDPKIASLRLVERERRRDGGPDWRGGQPDEQDTFEFRGLYEGTYDVVARTNSGAIGVVRGLAVEEDGQAREVVVRLEPAASVSVTCPADSKEVDTEFFSDGALVGSEYVHPGETHVFSVPPGPIRIRSELVNFQDTSEPNPDAYWTAAWVRFVDVEAVLGEVRRVELSSSGLFRPTRIR